MKQSFREGKSEMNSMMYDYSTAPRIHFRLMIINVKREHLACLFFFLQIAWVLMSGRGANLILSRVIDILDKFTGGRCERGS